MDPDSHKVVAIRAALASDAEAMGHVFVDSFRAAHRGQMPNWLLDTRTYDDSSSNWKRTVSQPGVGEHINVAVLDGIIAGVGMVGPALPWAPDEARRSSACTGECYALYVAPSAQGKGVGSLLLRTLARRLIDDGVERLLVGVLSANDRGCKFYSSLGGIVLGERTIVDEGIHLDEYVYVWDDLHLLRPTENMDRR